MTTMDNNLALCCKMKLCIFYKLANHHGTLTHVHQDTGPGCLKKYCYNSKTMKTKVFMDNRMFTALLFIITKKGQLKN